MASAAERDAAFTVGCVCDGAVYSRTVGSPTADGWNTVYDTWISAR